MADGRQRWHDDHLVFLNPGGLPSPLRLEDLKRPHRSVPRNRKVAEMFFYVGWIEQWGRGIQKMLDECAAAGLPEPEFKEYQRLAETSRETAKRDLTDLVTRSLLARKGTGRNVYYVLGQMGQKWVKNGSKGPES